MDYRLCLLLHVLFQRRVNLRSTRLVPTTAWPSILSRKTFPNLAPRRLWLRSNHHRQHPGMPSPMTKPLRVGSQIEKVQIQDGIMLSQIAGVLPRLLCFMFVFRSQTEDSDHCRSSCIHLCHHDVECQGVPWRLQVSAIIIERYWFLAMGMWSVASSNPQTTFLIHVLMIFRYILSDDKKKGGAKRLTEAVIHRRKPHPQNVGQTISIPYRITDNPLRLSPSEWWAFSLPLPPAPAIITSLLFFLVGSRSSVYSLPGQPGSSKVGLGSRATVHQWTSSPKVRQNHC